MRIAQDGIHEGAQLGILLGRRGHACAGQLGIEPEYAVAILDYAARFIGQCPFLVGVIAEVFGLRPGLALADDGKLIEGGLSRGLQHRTSIGLQRMNRA